MFNYFAGGASAGGASFFFFLCFFLEASGAELPVVTVAAGALAG